MYNYLLEFAENNLIIFNMTITLPQIASHSLRMHILEHNLRTDNISNANTPGYRAKEIEFSKELGVQLKGNNLNLILTSDKHISTSKPPYDPAYKIVAQTEGEEKPNRNNVSLTNEVVKMKENSAEYIKKLNLYKSLSNWTIASAGRKNG